MSLSSVAAAEEQADLGEIAPPDQAQPTPAAQPVPSLVLTADEQALLDRGLITDGEHVGGGILATFVGFGAGHAYQDRWLERGYIFTIGEPLALAAVFYGFAQILCQRSECTRPDLGPPGVLVTVGAVTFLGLRTWQAADAFGAPPLHNRRVRELRARLGGQAPTALVPYVVPPRDGDGAIAGLALQF